MSRKIVYYNDYMDKIWEDERERLKNVISDFFFRTFLKDLDDRERIIVLMKHQGYKQQEISAVLGVSQKYVSEKLSEIKEKYKKHSF